MLPEVPDLPEIVAHSLSRMTAQLELVTKTVPSRMGCTFCPPVKDGRPAARRDAQAMHCF